jgi:hypothetical protein
MFGKHAHRFGKVISDLWLLETICDRSADLTLEEGQLADTQEQIWGVLQSVSQLVAETGLEARLGPEIRRFETAFEAEALRKVAGRCDHLRERILDELDKESYFHLPQADSRYYTENKPFGFEVATKFAASTDDFHQSAKCLSLQQPTASVFHLMRGMETAVKQLAAILGLTITPQTTWRQLTASMDTKIQAMPNRTKNEAEQKNNWENARINLHHLGSVMRNNTMHPNVTHNQEEARHIFSAVNVVMNALCRL